MKENIFKKIGESESKRLMREACAKKIEVLLVSDEPELSFRAKGSGELDQMTYTVPKGRGDDVQREFLISFLLDDEKFFCKAICHISQGLVRIVSEFEVYQLQRRAHIRIEIEGGVKAHFSVSTYQGQTKKVEADVIDVSVGGALLEYSSSDFTPVIDDLLTGTLTLSFRSGISLEAKVRSILSSPKKGYQRAGIQFIYDDPLVESRLFTTVMNLSREINKKVFKNTKGVIKK